MGTRTITRTWNVGGVPTDPTSVKLSDAAGAYGVKRDDTDAVVVADGTDMTRVSAGVYEYTFTEPDSGLDYTAWVEVVYAGNTYRFEHDIPAVPSFAVLGAVTDDDPLISVARPFDGATPSGGLEALKRWFAAKAFGSKTFEPWALRGDQ